MDDYNEFEWSGHKWIPRERWGLVHPEKFNWWYDSKMVTIDDDGLLHLKTKIKPKTIKGPDENFYDSTVACGLISSTERFKYGKYEIEAKLPSGKGLWPAFWLWSWESWPPEIDVFEAYSNKSSDFFSYLNNNFHEWLLGRFWKVESNIHITKNKEHFAIGAKKSYFGFGSPSKRFFKYELIWLKDKIEIYYNGKINYRELNRNILSKFDNCTMNVILNNGIITGFNPNHIPESDFQIKYFKYTPL